MEPPTANLDTKRKPLALHSAWRLTRPICSDTIQSQELHKAALDCTQKEISCVNHPTVS